MKYSELLERFTTNNNILRDDFAPRYTPKDMLESGVFGGKYMNDIKDKYPSEWFENAKMVERGKPADPNLNKYKILAGQSLDEWNRKGWIDIDSHGWFEWYCNYFLGRRIPLEDDRQIKRWISFVHRHMGMVNKSDNITDKQKQSIFQWAWDYKDDYKDTKVLKRNQKYINKEMSKYEWVGNTWRCKDA